MTRPGIRVRSGRGVGEGARIPADYVEGVRLDAYRVAYHRSRRARRMWTGLLVGVVLAAMVAVILGVLGFCSY